jgi:N-methylhydantoinase A
LLATQVIAGPAIIEQMDSVSVVLPEHKVTVDDLGSLIIKKNN